MFDEFYFKEISIKANIGCIFILCLFILQPIYHRQMRNDTFHKLKKKDYLGNHFKFLNWMYDCMKFVCQMFSGKSFIHVQGWEQINKLYNREVIQIIDRTGQRTGVPFCYWKWGCVGWWNNILPSNTQLWSIVQGVLMWIQFCISLHETIYSMSPYSDRT